MPKRSADKASETQMVRLNARLWEMLQTEGARYGRTPRQEIEHRLQQSLAGGGDAPALTWGRAVGRLIALLADDIERYSHRYEEALAKLEAAVPALFGALADHIRKAVEQEKRELSEEERAWAVSQALSLAGKVQRAHLTGRLTQETRTEYPDTRENKELRMLQEGLGLSPQALKKMTLPPAGHGSAKGKRK